MLITQDTKNKTRNLELGGGLESGGGGDYVTGIEELEEQVFANGGRTHWSTARSSKLVVKNRKKRTEVPAEHVLFLEQI